MGRGRPAQAEALSFLLLFGAGLFVRSLQNLETTDTGVALDNLITFAVSPDLNGYDGERGTILLPPAPRAAALRARDPRTSAVEAHDGSYVHDRRCDACRLRALARPHRRLAAADRPV
jgi:hypothetical protein